jgi:hypothetical protein
VLAISNAPQPGWAGLRGTVRGGVIYAAGPLARVMVTDWLWPF